MRFLLLLGILLLITACTAAPIEPVAQEAPREEPQTIIKPAEPTMLAAPPEKEADDYYRYVLTPDDFPVKIYPIWSGMQEVDEMILSNIQYSRIKKHGYTGGYAVFYGSSWQYRISAYEYQFREYLYVFDAEADARNAFKDLNFSYFSGYLDKRDDKPVYEFAKDQSLRIISIRRQQKEYVNVNALLLHDGKVVDIEFIYSADYGKDHYKEILEKVRERIDNPAADVDIGEVYREKMRTSYIDKYEDDRFIIYLNTISVNASGEQVGRAKLFTFTVVNKNNYPFYPAIAYYTRRDLSALPAVLRDEPAKFDSEARWSIYNGDILDTGKQTTFEIPEDVQISYNADKTVRIDVELLDQYKGGRSLNWADTYPTKLATATFNVNLSNYQSG